MDGRASREGFLNPKYKHQKIQADNLERQGFDLHAIPLNTWKTRQRDTIRQNAVFGMWPTYPELDIQPTGKCKVRIRVINQIAQVKLARTESHCIDTEIPVSPANSKLT